MHPKCYLAGPVTVFLGLKIQNGSFTLVASDQGPKGPRLRKTKVEIEVMDLILTQFSQKTI